MQEEARTDSIMANFLTSQDIQELINVDRSTVYRMAEDGRLPAVKIGRQWRFPADRVSEQLGLEPSTPTRVVDPSGGSAAARLGDLLPPGVADPIAELIGELFGLMAVITDMNGEPITAVANPCGYYSAIAQQPGAVDACLHQWQLFASEPHVAARWVRTPLGILCARTFIWVDLKPVGMIVVGGIAPSEWPPPADRLDAIADNVGVPTEVLRAASSKVWNLDPNEQRHVLRLLPPMGDLVSQLAATRNALHAYNH